MNWRIPARVSHVLFTLLVALMLFGVRGATPAHAQMRTPTIPFSSNACAPTNGCVDYIQWSGRADHGGSVTVETSTPGLSGSDTYEKYLYLVNSKETVYVGMNSNDFCGSGQHYFWDYIVSGSSTYQCFNLPSGDDNKDVLLQASYYVSNGGGWFFTIKGNGGYACNPKPNCTYNAVSDSNATATVTIEGREDVLLKGSISGHAIWGTDWINNQYFNGSWNYYGSGVNGDDPYEMNNNGGAAPPLIYWHSLPDGTVNNGGIIWSCIYETGGSCTIGS